MKSVFHFEVYEWAFIGFLVVGSVSAFLTGVLPMAIIFQLRAFVITFLLLYSVKRLDITKRDITNFLIDHIYGRRTPYHPGARRKAVDAICFNAGKMDQPSAYLQTIAAGFMVL